jgi:hypothetical protein
LHLRTCSESLPGTGRGDHANYLGMVGGVP